MGRIADTIDAANTWVGRILCWSALVLALWQFGLIISQAVFRSSSLFAQELLIYINALLFLGAGGFTLLRGEHVRVDLFYTRFDARKKALVNITGTLLFLWPMLVLIFISGWPYVASSWALREGSMETSGIQAVFLLKTLILVFAGLLGLQSISLVLRSLAALKDRQQ